MKLSIKFADDVNRLGIRNRRNNSRLMARPDGAHGRVLVPSAQRTKAIAPAKVEKTALKIIERGDPQDKFVSGAAFSPILASMIIHGAPQEVH